MSKALDLKRTRFYWHYTFGISRKGFVKKEIKQEDLERNCEVCIRLPDDPFGLHINLPSQ